MISGDSTVGRLLDAHPQLVEVLAGYHPHLKHLRSEGLGKVARRVTVTEAARMAGVPAEELLAVLRRAVGEAAAPETAQQAAAPAHGGGSAPRPAALEPLAESQQVNLDVRADIAQGREPFARIMAAVRGLGEGQVLVLRAPFEPVPLYDVLGRRGFAHWSECRGPADWSAWFYRETPRLGTPAPGAAPPAPAGETNTVRVDVRGLEPPQPMMRVLERLDALRPGQRLEVIHDRRPIFLYPQLNERGFAHETDEPEPGIVRIVIRRESRSR